MKRICSHLYYTYFHYFLCSHTISDKFRLFLFSYSLALNFIATHLLIHSFIHTIWLAGWLANWLFVPLFFTLSNFQVFFFLSRYCAEGSEILWIFTYNERESVREWRKKKCRWNENTSSPRMLYGVYYFRVSITVEVTIKFLYFFFI